jgi:hypothetical protein
MSKAGQFGARVCLLLAAALAAHATQHQAPLESAPIQWLAWLHVELLHLIFGLVGAGLMLTRKPVGWMDTIATLVCGVAIASVGTPLAIEYLLGGSAKPATANAIAAVAGAAGIYIVEAARKILEAFAASPVGAVLQAWNLWRGRGTPATPPQEPLK